ncbi:universal stress protein [Mangrovimonas sp. TPBH4]|uniref:universal stress protein n=1 Tax=Mangrovimonas sp. TPBH4 TaxID=1645914 RepID=UPI0006B5F2BA|nr:universal stress protein [Mangrovimonas sp. TPBH4]
MESKAQRILVLSDLGSTTATTLKSAVSLANMVNGSIELFHVKKPGDIVQKENQLSAIRSINEEKNSTKKSIQKMIQPIEEVYGITIQYSFVFGNVKNEIGTYLKERRPDIIVMGKRPSKLISLGGDGLTQFVMEEHEGPIMISGLENGLEPKQPLSMGVFNGSYSAFAKSLLPFADQPIKSFKIANGDDSTSETEQSTDHEAVEFVFEAGDQTIKNMSNYLSKSSVNLFCIDRGQSKTKKNTKSKHTDIYNIVNNLNISLLLSI